MRTTKRKARSALARTSHLAKKTAVGSGRVAGKTATVAVRTVKKIPQTKVYQKTKQVTKQAHYVTLQKPHEKLMLRSKKYAWWHSWQIGRFNHKHVHGVTVTAHIALIVVMILHSAGIVFAADLADSWNFSNPNSFTMDTALETSGSSARLKGQSYSPDGNTAALYHMDEGSGATLGDTSGNGNNATTVGAPSFVDTNLNKGLALNGSNQYASAPDSPSLSMTGQQSVEGWIKPSQTFSQNSGSNSQTIIDKGSYKLGLDATSGRAYYDIQNSNSEQWSQKLGIGMAGGWDNGFGVVWTMIGDGTNVYAGTGSTNDNAQVWKWNGSEWSILGGRGINGSWGKNPAYNSVRSLIINGTTLYAGLGHGQGLGAVWSCNLATNCDNWVQIGGLGVGAGGPITNDWYYSAESMTILGGKLYVGMTGSCCSKARVYRYEDNKTWTKIGGDGLNNSWNNAKYEGISSLFGDGTDLYAGLGSANTASSGVLWRWNGSTWTQIGGDNIDLGGGASWDSSFSKVGAISKIGGSIYVGLGGANGGWNNFAKVWRLNGNTWTKIGGDGLNGSWNANQYSEVNSMTTDGTNLYASTGTGSTSGDVWKWDGNSWTKIGSGANAGNNMTSWRADYVKALLWQNNSLYATPWSLVYKWNGSSWSAIGGFNINKSWDPTNIGGVSSTANFNGKAYFGLSGTNAGSAQVYEYDGTTALRIGGSGLDGSWPALTYAGVYAMQSYKGALYVGLGSGANQAEVWKWNGSSWSKVAGTGINGTWNNGEPIVRAMTVWNNKLYVGLGGGGTYADIWQFDGSSWAQVAGEVGSNANNKVNNSWSGFSYITALTVFDGKLCAGVLATYTANTNCWDGGSNWTKIGGGGTNSSWPDGGVLQGISIDMFNGRLHATINQSTPNGLIASVWRYDGGSWTKIGGSGINGSWPEGYYYLGSFVTYNGALYVGSWNNGPSGSTVWRWDGSTWTQEAGSSINGSWSSAGQTNSLSVYNGKLYASTSYGSLDGARIYAFGGNAYVDSSPITLDNNWHHIAGTYDGSKLKIFLDGNMVASKDTVATGVDNSLPLLIGNSYGSGLANSGQQNFNGSIDEVRISNTARSSFNSKPFTNSPQTISLASATRTSGVKGWVGFSDNETLNGGSIKYRLSHDNGTTWQYWDGSAWSNSSSTAQANSVNEVNSHISTFPAGFGGIKWQAILQGDGNQRVTLNSVTITADSDLSAPDTNAQDINAFISNGGASIDANAWTNSPTPYFTWQAGTDAGSGIYGYCLYLGQTSSSDPTTTKGLLGTSPSDTGDQCQYVTNTNSLDLSNGNVLATALSSSTSPYYLNIKAMDKAGNVFGSSAQFQFRFDNTPPTNPAFVTAPGEFVSDKTVTFTWPTAGGDIPSDSHSGIAGLQYRIGVGGQWRGGNNDGSGLLPNNGSYTTRDLDFADINNGNNVFYFRAVDTAGNVASGGSTATLKLNTGAPNSPQNLAANPATNTQNSFAFSWDPPSSFAGSPNNLTYCYTVNTLPTANNCVFTSPGQTSLSAGAYATQPGDNTFYVVARDNNINYATASSVTFTANTSAPGIPLNLDIADVSTKSTSTWRLALSWNPPTNIGAGIANYRIYRSPNNNSNFTQVATTSGTSYVDGGLNSQEYYYKIRACDSANNCGADSTIVHKLPTGKFTTPASITAQPNVTSVSTKKATIRWSTDRNSDSKILIGTRSGEYQPYQVASVSQVTDHLVELNNLSPGTTYFAKASWTDEDGNTGVSSEFSFATIPAPTTQEVAAQRVGLTSAQIQFTSVSAAQVVIQFGATDSFGGVKTTDTSLTKSTYTAELTGLSDGTKYFYRLNTFDAEGNEYVGTTVLTFTTPARPRISNLRFQPVEGEATSTQKVSWTTNVPTTSLIRLSASNVPNIEISNSNLVTDHEVIVRDLLDDSDYTLIAESRDKDGNLATSDSQTFKTALDTRPPKITELTIETSIKGTGAEGRGQVVVSWKTDEPATSQVAYGEGADVTTFINKTAEASSLTTEHTVIVSDLPTSRVYSIQPISKDKSANQATGVSQTAIVGRSSDNILTIILTALKRVFGL